MKTKVKPMSSAPRSVRKGRQWTELARLVRRSLGLLGWVMLIVAAGYAPAQSPSPSLSGDISPQQTARRPLPAMADETQMPTLSAKQKQSIMQANFAKSKSDVAELAALAKELREQLDKPNSEGVSVDVASRAERIEKLAKKIREEMKGL